VRPQTFSRTRSRHAPASTHGCMRRLCAGAG
jgi:hypothetical protein